MEKRLMISIFLYKKTVFNRKMTRTRIKQIILEEVPNIKPGTDATHDHEMIMK